MLCVFSIVNVFVNTLLNNLILMSDPTIAQMQGIQAACSRRG